MQAKSVAQTTGCSMAVFMSLFVWNRTALDRRRILLNLDPCLAQCHSDCANSRLIGLTPTEDEKMHNLASHPHYFSRDLRAAVHPSAPVLASTLTNEPVPAERTLSALEGLMAIANIRRAAFVELNPNQRLQTAERTARDAAESSREAEEKAAEERERRLEAERRAEVAQQLADDAQRRIAELEALLHFGH